MTQTIRRRPVVVLALLITMLLSLHWCEEGPPWDSSRVANAAHASLSLNHLTVWDGKAYEYDKLTPVSSWWSLMVGFVFTSTKQCMPWTRVFNKGSASHPFLVRFKNYQGVETWNTGWKWVAGGGASQSWADGIYQQHGIDQANHGRAELWTDLDGTGPDAPTRLWVANPWVYDNGGDAPPGDPSTMSYKGTYTGSCS